MLMNLESYATLKRKFAFRAKGRSAKQKDRKVWFGDISVIGNDNSLSKE
jgi:hypothetical protein